MRFLGKYEHPRPRPSWRYQYPWIEAEPGDWFLVYGEAGADLIRCSVSSCATEAMKRYDWKPKFRTHKKSEHVLMVERVA